MPIKHSYTDKTLSNPVLDSAYSVVSEFHFNLSRKQIVFSYDVYRDEDAYKNKREKISTEIIYIDDIRHESIYGDPELLQAGVEEVLDDSGNVITPGTDPVYGDPVLLKAAVPSFDEVLGANIPTYINLAKSIYDVALTQTTTFPNGEFIAPDKYELR